MLLWVVSLAVAYDEHTYDRLVTLWENDGAAYYVLPHDVLEGTAAQTCALVLGRPIDSVEE